MSPSTRHLARHYAEMVAAMFLGMAVLGIPAGWALEAAGTSWTAVNDDAPALMLLAMAAMMTAPMVGWMAYRGHGRRANLDMSAAMFVPAFAAMPFLLVRRLRRPHGARARRHAAGDARRDAAAPRRVLHGAHGSHETVTA